MLSVEESCSGGMLAERITAVPGSSDYFLGRHVAARWRREDRIALRAIGDWRRGSVLPRPQHRARPIKTVPTGLPSDPPVGALDWLGKKIGLKPFDSRVPG